MGDYGSWFVSTEKVYNIPKDIAMHCIRINNEDPDPGEPNQTLKHPFCKKVGCNKTMSYESNSVTKLCAFFI
jgi:hypothetical protein